MTVLSCKYQHCLVEGKSRSNNIYGRTFSLVMNDLCLGVVPYRVTAFSHSPAKIQVFTIHEKLFIKTADRNELRSSDKHERS